MFLIVLFVDSVFIIVLFFFFFLALFCFDSILPLFWISLLGLMSALGKAVYI